MPRIALNEVHSEAFLPCFQRLPGLGELLREAIRPRQGKACILSCKPWLMNMCFWQLLADEHSLGAAAPFPAPLWPMLESALVLKELGLL